MTSPSTRIVLDGHTDVAGTGEQLSLPLDDAIAGGVSAAVVAVRAAQLAASSDPAPAAREHESFHRAILDTVEASGGRAAIAHSPEAVRENAARGVFSYILGFQNARPLMTLGDIEAWIDRGVAVFDFGFVGSNQWAKSSRPYPYASVPGDFEGISGAAEGAVGLLNRRGVVIDTAQVSVEARARILELSQAPVIASHNGLRSLVGQADRTIADDEVRAIAERGGIVNIVAFDGYLIPRGSHPQVVADIRELRERYGLPGFRSTADYYAVLDPETADWDEQRFTDYFAEYHRLVRHDWPRSDVHDLVEAVRHVADLVGVEHVGIASDFHHGGGIGGWLDYRDTPTLTAALEGEFSAAEVDLVWGGNFLRVWGEVQQAR